MLKAENSLIATQCRSLLLADVTGITARQVVQFTFIFGDPDLAVELVLPISAFREFCSENDCTIIVRDERLQARISDLVRPLEILSSVGTPQTSATAMEIRS